MNILLINIILALAWVALTGNFTPANFAFGFLLGYLAILISRPQEGTLKYLWKFPKIIFFIIFFIIEVTKANLRVAYDVLTPTHRMKPGVISFRMSAREDTEITLLMNMISLTPGTLSIDVSDDRSILYIHAMYIDNLDDIRKEIGEFERRLLEVMR